MRPHLRVLIVVLVGLTAALAMQPLFGVWEREGRVQKTRANLRQAAQAVWLYMGDDLDLFTFERRQPPLKAVLNGLVPRESLYSPCLSTGRRTTAYWDGLDRTDDAVLFSNLSCGELSSWRDPLTRKRGLGITRSGRALDITAYGDPESALWWTDPQSRL